MTYDELNYRIGVSVDESIKDDSSLIFHLLPPAEQAVGEKLVDISMKSNGWVVFRAEVIDVPSSVFYDKLDKVLHCKFNLVETHRVIHILPDYNNYLKRLFKKYGAE